MLHRRVRVRQRRLRRQRMQKNMRLSKSHKHQDRFAFCWSKFATAAISAVPIPSLLLTTSSRTPSGTCSTSSPAHCWDSGRPATRASLRAINHRWSCLNTRTTASSLSRRLSLPTPGRRALRAQIRSIGR